MTQAQDSSESHHGATQKPEDHRLREKQGYHLLTCFFKVLLRKPFLRLGQPGGLLGVGVTEGLRVMVVGVGLRRWAGVQSGASPESKGVTTETVLGLRASWAFRQGLHRGSQRSWGSQRQGTEGAGASWPPQGWTDLKSDRQAAVRHTQEKCTRLMHRAASRGCGVCLRPGKGWGSGGCGKQCPPSPARSSRRGEKTKTSSNRRPRLPKGYPSARHLGPMG